jgi:hypothetical protein
MHTEPGSDDLAPDLVLGPALQGEIAQPGVLGAADAVFAPGPLPVAEFEVSVLAALGAGGKDCKPVPVDVGDPQLGARVRALPSRQRTRSSSGGGGGSYSSSEECLSTWRGQDPYQALSSQVKGTFHVKAIKALRPQAKSRG